MIIIRYSLQNNKHPRLVLRNGLGNQGKYNPPRLLLCLLQIADGHAALGSIAKEAPADNVEENSISNVFMCYSYSYVDYYYGIDEAQFSELILAAHMDASGINDSRWSRSQLATKVGLERYNRIYIFRRNRASVPNKSPKVSCL